MPLAMCLMVSCLSPEEILWGRISFYPCRRNRTAKAAMVGVFSWSVHQSPKEERIGLIVWRIIF